MVRVLVMTVQGRPGQNSKIRGQCRAAKPDIDAEADAEPVRSKYQVRADIEDWARHAISSSHFRVRV
jgi:hypothetical protein